MREMADNPYKKHTVAKLKEIEQNLLKSTRDPKMPGHKRRVALRDLQKVREALREKGK